MSKQIELGKIVNTRGLKGEMKIYPYTDCEMFYEIPYVKIENKSYDIVSVKPAKNMVFIMLSGVTTVEEAEKLRDKSVTIDEEDLPETQDNEYYIKDIADCKILLLNGDYFGTVSGVFKTGSNDVYEVKKEDGKLTYIPAIADVVKNIDIENKVITINLIDGLEDL